MGELIFALLEIIGGILEVVHTTTPEEKMQKPIQEKLNPS